MSHPNEAVLQPGGLPGVVVPGVVNAITAAIDQMNSGLAGTRARSSAIEGSLAGAGGSTDPDYAKTAEVFTGMSHQQIYDSVHGQGGMDPAGLRTLAGVWQDASTQLTGTAEQTWAVMTTLLGNGEWSGASGDAARTAIARIAKVVDTVGQVYSAVGVRLETMSYTAEAVRAAVQAPITPMTSLNPDDPLSSIIPGLANPQTVTDDRTQADQLAASTRAAMASLYSPSYPPAGSGVPSYPVVGQDAASPGSGQNPVDVDTSGVEPGTSPDSPTAPAPETAAGEPDSTAPADQTTESSAPSDGDQDSGDEPGSGGSGDDSGADIGTDTDTQAASTGPGSPSSPTPSVNPLGVGGGGNPSGSLGPGAPGVNGPAAPIAGPGAGRIPTVAAGVSSSGASAAASRPTGSMGPMMPGAGARKGEDEKEHRAPDYLRRVHPDWDTQDPVLSGVIGADELSPAPGLDLPVIAAPAPLPPPREAADSTNHGVDSTEAATEAPTPPTSETADPGQAAALPPDLAGLLSSFGWDTTTTATQGDSAPDARPSTGAER